MAKRIKGDEPLRRVFRLFVYAVALIVLIFCATASYHFGLKIFSARGMAEAPGQDFTIEVKEGTTVRALGDELERYGIIEDSNVFYVQSLIYEVKTVKPGNYVFNSSMSGEKLLGVITAGPLESQEEQ